MTDNKIKEVHNDLEEVKLIMNENINNMMENGENVKILQKKTEDLKKGANDFTRNTGSLRNKLCLQNCKQVVILTLILLFFIAVIIGLIVSTVKW